MEMLKLLIADSGEEFRLSMTERLQGTYILRVCQEGNETLEAIRSFRPDLVLLDMMLPGLDGITILQRAAEEGFHPMVLASSRYVNDYILESVERLNVGYVMVKPCEIRATEDRLRDLSQRRSQTVISVPDPATTVSNMLLTLGVPTKLRGFACLREAILEEIRLPGQQITKTIYPAVAKVCGGNAEQVERAIRSAVLAAWNVRDEQAWRMYFHADGEGALRRPTNAAFITALAGRIRMGLEAR